VDGDRSSEHMLGVALQGRRSEAVIASKFGMHAGEDQTVYDGAAVTMALDASLDALQTDYIDLLQIHWPGNVGFIESLNEPGSWPSAVAGVVEALEQAVAAGKIKHYGWCNFGTDDMAAFKAAGGRAVTNQLPYNLLWRPIECGILPTCREQSVGVLCYSPLAQALLTGKYVNSKMVPEGRRRSRLFAYDSTPHSRHGGRGMEDELFSPGAPAPDGNERTPPFNTGY
jgi:myo-inositol catabolism protein IolS